MRLTDVSFQVQKPATISLNQEQKKQKKSKKNKTNSYAYSKIGMLFHLANIFALF